MERDKIDIFRHSTPWSYDPDSLQFESARVRTNIHLSKSEMSVCDKVIWQWSAKFKPLLYKTWIRLHALLSASWF